MEAREQEKRNRRIGFLTSLGIHGALFLALFFLVAWRAPDPPLPEFGIELNFGLDAEGSGDVQPETPVGEETDQTSETLEQPTVAQPEEVKPEVKEEIKETTPEKAVEQAVSQEESPVVVKEEKKKEVKKDIVKDKPTESSTKEKVVAEYKKDEKKDATATDASKKGTTGSQGDDVNKTGDKGSPEGKLDAKSLYGTPGGGGGGEGDGLSMSGWSWASPLKEVDLPDNENGKVVFEIECDEKGEITRVDTKEHGLSAPAEKILRDLIRENSLVRDHNSKGRIPERSKGTVTFTLKTK